MSLVSESYCATRSRSSLHTEAPIEPLRERILGRVLAERAGTDRAKLDEALVHLQNAFRINPDDLAKATGAQVLNTKAIGIRFAEMCVACGMTQSALTYPRAKLSYEDFVNK